VSKEHWSTKDLDPALLAALTQELPPTQLWSLLLAVAERRAAQRSPAKLLQQYEQDRFVCPAIVDPRAQLEIDRELFAAAEGFEAIELSPLAPLGVCSVVAPTSQNRIVSTMRGTEIVSDPTNVLALESARRLRAAPTRIVKLATSHRCVRAQPVPKQSGFTAHFRIFCLTSAGHETKDQGFTVDSLAEHIRTHLTALNRLEQLGYRIPEPQVRLLATPEREPVALRLAARLEESGIGAARGPLDKAYYDGIRFMISAGTGSNEGIPLIDGGAFDWVGKLLANRKMVFIASAIGSQLVAHAFRSK